MTPETHHPHDSSVSLVGPLFFVPLFQRPNRFPPSSKRRSTALRRDNGGSTHFPAPPLARLQIFLVGDTRLSPESQVTFFFFNSGIPPRSFFYSPPSSRPPPSSMVVTVRNPYRLFFPIPASDFIAGPSWAAVIESFRPEFFACFRPRPDSTNVPI